MPRTCATMQHHFSLAAVSAEYRDARRTAEYQTQRLRALSRTQVLTIPVVVHVLYTEPLENVSDAQIESQIAVLNEDFRLLNPDHADIPAPFAPYAGDALLEFRLANRDPKGNATAGVVRTQVAAPFMYDRNDPDPTLALDRLIKRVPTGAEAWPRDSYLNLWVCPIEGGLLGYAQFPGGPASTDGVVINFTAFGTEATAEAPYDLGRTAVHEIGHWLNLLHIWGDDKGGCLQSDNVSDTPNQAGSNGQTPMFPSISCNNAPHGDMFMNYMDYTDDEAMYMFTKGQIDRMNATLLGTRASLALSKGWIDNTRAAQPGFQLRALGGVPPTTPTIFDGVDWV